MSLIRLESVPDEGKVASLTSASCFYAKDTILLACFPLGIPAQMAKDKKCKSLKVSCCFKLPMTTFVKPAVSLQENMEVLQVQNDQASEEISLTSSEEAELLKTQSVEDSSVSKKLPLDNSSLSWEIREGVEITLTAQPEDTVVAEERLDITEVKSSEIFLQCYCVIYFHPFHRMMSMLEMMIWTLEVKSVLPQECQANKVLLCHQNHLLPILVQVEFNILECIHDVNLVFYRKRRWR